MRTRNARPYILWFSYYLTQYAVGAAIGRPKNNRFAHGYYN